MPNPTDPKKGWFALVLQLLVVTVVLPAGLWTTVSLYIWFFRPKPPGSPRTTSITEVLKQEEGTEDRDETALLEGAETGDQNLLDGRNY